VTSSAYWQAASGDRRTLTQEKMWIPTAEPNSRPPPCIVALHHSQVTLPLHQWGFVATGAPYPGGFSMAKVQYTCLGLQSSARLRLSSPLSLYLQNGGGGLTDGEPMDRCLISRGLISMPGAEAFSLSMFCLYKLWLKNGTVPKAHVSTGGGGDVLPLSSESTRVHIRRPVILPVLQSCPLLNYLERRRLPAG
jgi:hypothetical protein